MKKEYLKIALLSILFVILKYKLFILFPLFLVYRKNVKAILLSCFLFSIYYLLLTVPYVEITQRKAVIQDIKSNYVIAQTEQGKIILRNIKGVNFDDYIYYYGEISKIDASISSYGFNYKTFCNSQNLYYQCDVVRYYRINEGKTLRHYLYKVIDSQSEPLKSFLKSVIFQISSSDSVYVSSGSYISGILAIFEKGITSLFDFIYAGPVLYLLICLLFHGKFVFLRLFIKQALKKTKLNYKDQTGLLILILMLINPKCIYLNAFIFPMMIQVMNCFINRNNKIQRMTTLGLIKLILTYRVTFFDLFIMPYYRKAISYFSLVCIVSILLPILQIPCSFIISHLSFIEKISVFTLKGSLQFPLILIFLVFMARKMEQKQAIISAIFIFAFFFLNINHSLGSVTFINVSQGDCILIRLPLNQGNYLIDTGDKRGYSNLQSYLDALGITTIDTIFITHNDSDHNGNLETLQSDYKIKEIIDQKMEIYDDGKILFQFLLPEYHSDEDNENSLVLYLSYYGTHFLFTGDITEKEEKMIAQRYHLIIDVLKCAHHGSATATSEYFLSHIEPKYAIISAGLNNYYHHPSYEVVERLSHYNLSVYNTSLDGDICFVMTPFYTFLCTSRKILI